MQNPRVLLLGEKKFDERMASVAKGSLSSISPSLVMSDLSTGWNLIAAKEAQLLGARVMGVFPHTEVIGSKIYEMDRKEVLKYINTKVAFNDTYFEYLKKPASYFTWVRQHTDVVLAYLNPNVSSVSHSIMIRLKDEGKTVFNLYRETSV